MLVGEPQRWQVHSLITYHWFTSQDTEDADGANQFRSIDHKWQV